ncbi:MAG: tRNA U-34 5-methylaminomethyl-2-thiouridine biosynthesis protein [Micavibrio aeruginosavorus]|uniref:tRNA U-34 5-methylaminomethyl-2-thiouridine biosynthesis protein n=1 Tax=Micavibrio aeruginosavorus TaxID=349221 RepID=A0A2W4ZZY4_9BACT|nr:MAG: tRNA U-34 5-methylaminomethyl-2-thiouridine biosynthesis protein [Micavibrio aeruginosavorus]
MTDTPRSEQFDDVYFSAKDGAAETEHVFLNGNNLPEAWQGKARFCIGETGFGTGLNFLVAWEAFEKTAEVGAFLDFVSVEKYPLRVEDIRKGLSPWAERLAPYLDKMTAQYPMNVPGFHRMVFDNRVALTLVFGDANEVLPQIEGSVDAWFLDGFTPSKNPDMWTETVFREMARLSHKDTTFATFTAAGFVKRGLREAGFTVEKRKGFGWKADMLAGRFNGERERAKPLYERGTRIAVHGAGLAGCAAAYVLRQYGFEPVLYDPNGIASGASGNPIGLINPRFSAFRTADSDFYAAAFAMAARVFPLLEGTGYQVHGALHLITDAEKEKKLSRTAENWGWDASLMRVADAAEASKIAGVTVGHPALYLSRSASISPLALCKAYAAGVPLAGDMPEGMPAVYAVGAGSPEHPALAGLPLHTVRGQITFAAAMDESARLETSIGYSGYVAPAVDGVHTVGSTFQKWMSDTNVRVEDDAANLANLAAALPSFPKMDICGSRASLRTSARDRFPVVGMIEGGFVSTAHGSHGIISSLMAAHLIADMARGGPYCLGKASVKALSPQRFQGKAV